MDKEILIFCESYPQIRNILYLATHTGNNHRTTLVITGNPDLFSFFKVINERVYNNTLNLVFFDIYRGRTAKAGNRVIKALRILPDIVKERGYLKGVFQKYLSELRGAEIYFFSRCYNPSTFYLLKRLSKTNRIVYMPDPAYDAVLINKAASANIIELVNLLKDKMVYGWDISLGKHPLGQKTTLIPDKFFRRLVARVISREERDSMLRDFELDRFKVFDDGNYGSMYFHEDLIEHDYIADPAEFEKTITEVFEILGKHFSSDEVALKYHPGSSGSGNDTVLPFGNRLPDFIPAEFLYNDKTKMYLGISTMALANVEKGVAISLIDLIGFKNDTIKNGLKKALIQWSHSEIQFPQSLDEFEKILATIKPKGAKLMEGAK